MISNEIPIINPTALAWKHHASPIFIKSSISTKEKATMEVEEPKPSQFDYATLYEEWHLQQEKATNDANSKEDPGAYVKALTARAGRIGTLQCAIQKKSKSENPKFLQALVERLELEDKGRRPIPVPTYVVEQQKHQHKPLPAVHVDVSMDDFFEEYPECVRPDTNAIGGNESSDESSDEEDERERRPKKRPLSTTTNLPAETLPGSTQAAATGCILYSSQNSYNKEQSDASSQIRSYPQHISNQQQLPPRPHRNPQHAFPPPDTHNRMPQSNEPQNPFQSAREYAHSIGDQIPTNNPPKNQQQQQYHNPYRDSPQPPEEEVVVLPQGPPIRESLQRKFKPPKLGASKPNNSKDTKKKTNAAKLGATSKPSNNDDDSEDDDLPEELKKFGKELVGKIESEIMDSGEPITFNDIAGLEDPKETIQEIVIWPMKRPDLFTGLRRTPNGLLLFGPPGTGKTLIGKAIAHESGATFFSISSSALTSKWMGEGEKLVRTLFAVASHREPSTVFLDEVDSLLTQRKSDDSEASRRIKTEFLVQLDGTATTGQGRVLVIGATNRPQELDEAARRRFIKRIYIPLPTESDRACLLKVLLEKNHNTLSTNDIDKLARETNGFSGADLKALSADAAMGPIRQLGRKALEVKVEDLPPISYKHFRQSLRGMRPSVSPEDTVQYKIFDETYGSKRGYGANMGDDSDEENDAKSGTHNNPT